MTYKIGEEVYSCNPKSLDNPAEVHFVTMIRMRPERGEIEYELDFNFNVSAGLVKPTFEEAEYIRQELKKAVEEMQNYQKEKAEELDSIFGYFDKESFDRIHEYMQSKLNKKEEE